MPSENAIALNCRMLRTGQGLSQVELADKVGLSRAGYLKIEQGESIPRADTLAKIAAALRVSMAQLMRSPEQLENARFRSKRRINSRDELLVEVKQRLDAYQELSAALGEPRQQPPSIKRSGTIEHSARLLRTKLLGRDSDEPIHDICGLVENAGYRLLKVSLSSAFSEEGQESDRAEGFFGLSVLGDGERPPAIVVNDFERISVERRIFTVAHELAHLQLHVGSYASSDPEEREGEEREADLFASHFLMPNHRFQKEWEEAYGLPFVERILKVKRIFRVSYKTLLRRLSDNGEEGGAKLYPRFFATYKRRFQRSLTAREEPHGLEESDFEADVLPSLVRRGVEKDLLSQARGAELLGMTLVEFRERAAAWNLPE